MSWRVEVVPGNGTVLRRGGIVAWAGPGVSTALLGFLDGSARNLAPSARGGRLLAEHVATVLRRHDPEPGAAFGVIGPDGDGALAVLVHGPAQCFDGTAWRVPPPDVGWTVLRAPFGTTVLLAAAGRLPERHPTPTALDLEAGCVPGGAVALVVDDRTPARAAGVQPTEAAGSQPTAADRSAADHTVADDRPADPTPSDPEPSDPEPSDPEASDPEPTDPEPSDPGPTGTERTHPERAGTEPTWVAGAEPTAAIGTEPTTALPSIATDAPPAE